MGNKHSKSKKNKQNSDSFNSSSIDNKSSFDLDTAPPKVGEIGLHFELNQSQKNEMIKLTNYI